MSFEKALREIAEEKRLAALMPEVERVLEAMIGVCEVHAFESFAIKLEALLAKIKGAKP